MNRIPQAWPGREVVELIGEDSFGRFYPARREEVWRYATTDSYRDCVLKTVNLGSDTDTTACVAGALASTAYGIGSIPQEWRDALRGADVLRGVLP